MKKFWSWTRNEDTGQRELWLDGVIAEETWWGDEVTPTIFKEELNAGSGAVLLHINSPGGDCVAASQIYTMLMDYPGDVVVQIDSLAASAASVIAMAGTTIKMSPTALMMVHNPWTSTVGDAAEMQKAINLLDEVKESLINAYEIKTGMSRKQLSEYMDAETWMNAHKAKELGFCDEVLYEDEEEESGTRPDFIFSARASSLALMNKISASMPKLTMPAERIQIEAAPVVSAIIIDTALVTVEQDNTKIIQDKADTVAEAVPATDPVVPEPEAEPVPLEPDNRVKAADLEKRLSLLK